MSTKKGSVIALFCIALTALSLILFLIGDINITSSSSLGTVRLNIETYLAGENQPTHPSVYIFDEPWNGYKYWLAYSPYPEGNGEEENPCIAVSNDLYYWETPGTLANPIATNEETVCNELKDPILFTVRILIGLKSGILVVYLRDSEAMVLACC